MNRITKILLLALTAAVLFAGCGREKKIKPSLPVGDSVESVPNFVMENFTLKSAQKGEVKWEVNAKGAQVFELKKKAYAQGFVMNYLDANNSKTVLYGDRAVIDTDTNFMEITGNVKAISGDGAVVRTNRLFWDDRRKKMYTEEEVTVTRDGTVLKGIGLETDAGFKNLEIKRRVTLKAVDVGE
ncbi:MAG TPA: LPS export ABC transporter periplasmic protein LptC [Candidatus Goldiibacteriota bacterium]|nr:LPS export ABC transporter periplasmic protein LptC [Candidatus Goldiibacteriota bacterium]HPN63619.1 LPS export ABC transporter periplasmic protein LptC [Candidatus Goldiibacteriota bacterium]HRQ42898.1 LPS export ABC transporter periplasmic protein LptC [Candidatus Goldiibacteriota bacterium]